MNEETEKAVDILTQRFAELTDALANNAGPAAKVAWNVAMTATQIEAILLIVFGIISGVISLFLAKAAIRFGKAAAAASYSDDFPLVLATIGFSIVTCISGIISMVHLLSAQNWVTAISPEAGLALRILNGL